MTGYKIGMAEEAVIADLTAKLTECQAREARLREVLGEWIDDGGKAGKEFIEKNYPSDDTALKEFKRKVLLAAADKLQFMQDGKHSYADETLRRMAEE